jgi:hypothetical protein
VILDMALLALGIMITKSVEGGCKSATLPNTFGDLVDGGHFVRPCHGSPPVRRPFAARSPPPRQVPRCHNDGRYGRGHVDLSSSQGGHASDCRQPIMPHDYIPRIRRTADSILRSSASPRRPSRRRSRGLSTVCRSVQLTYDTGYFVTPASGPMRTCVTSGPADPVMTATVTADSGTAIRLTVSMTTGCGPAIGTAHAHTSPRIAMRWPAFVTTAPRPRQPTPPSLRA